MLIRTILKLCINLGKPIPMILNFLIFEHASLHVSIFQCPSIKFQNFCHKILRRFSCLQICSQVTLLFVAVVKIILNYLMRTLQSLRSLKKGNGCSNEFCILRGMSDQKARSFLSLDICSTCKLQKILGRLSPMSKPNSTDLESLATLSQCHC